MTKLILKTLQIKSATLPKETKFMVVAEVSTRERSKRKGWSDIISRRKTTSRNRFHGKKCINIVEKNLRIQFSCGHIVSSMPKVGGHFFSCE